MAFEAADQDRVLTRVTEILNLCDAGGFSKTLSPRIKTRNADAIAAFVTEAGYRILQTVASVPNEFRDNYVTEITPIPYRSFLPDHFGQPTYVDIMPYAGATWIPAAPLSYQKIDSYRNNPNVYDPLGKAHDVKDSVLAGYYDIWEQRFYFTGADARTGLAQVTRDMVATMVPGFLENTWIRLGIGEAGKSGLGQYDLGIVTMYGQKGEADLAEFKTGKRTFAEVSEPEPTNEVHVQ
jgi:hypothetical protein